MAIECLPRSHPDCDARGDLLESDHRRCVQRRRAASARCSPLTERAVARAAARSREPGIASPSVTPAAVRTSFTSAGGTRGAPPPASCSSCGPTSRRASSRMRGRHRISRRPHGSTVSCSRRERGAASAGGWPATRARGIPIAAPSCVARPGWAWTRIVRTHDDYSQVLERLAVEHRSAREPERAPVRAAPREPLSRARGTLTRVRRPRAAGPTGRRCNTCAVSRSHGTERPDEITTDTPPATGLEEERRTSPVELLWDLVFVFAITQVTTLLSRDLTWAGFGRAMLVLALVWWAWSAFVWAANAQDAASRALRGMPAARRCARSSSAASPCPTRSARGDAVRGHLRGRALPAPGAVRGRLAQGQRVLVGDRRLRADGRDRDGPADRRARSCRRAGQVVLWLLAAAIDYAGPGLADPRAAARPAAGGGGALRRALQPVRDHLPGRVDRGHRRGRAGREPNDARRSSRRWRSAC